MSRVVRKGRAASTPLVRWLAVLMVAALPSARAAAEERTGRGYVMAGVAFPRQGGVTGEVHQTYIRAPGGLTRGWLGGAGIFVIPAVSLELELSTTGVMRARESTRYNTIINAERQDRWFALAVRYHVRSNRVVGLEPLLGIALVSTRSWSQAEYYSFSNPPQLLTVHPRQRNDLPIRAGLMAGIDLRVGTARVAVVPSFRIQAAPAGDAIDSTYPGGGFPVFTFRPGVAVRLQF